MSQYYSRSLKDDNISHGNAGENLTLDNTLHQLLQQNHGNIEISANSNVKPAENGHPTNGTSFDEFDEINSEWLENDMLNGKNLTLESLLENQPEELLFGLEGNESAINNSHSQNQLGEGDSAVNELTDGVLHFEDRNIQQDTNNDIQKEENEAGDDDDIHHHHHLFEEPKESMKQSAQVATRDASKNITTISKTALKVVKPNSKSKGMKRSSNKTLLQSIEKNNDASNKNFKKVKSTEYEQLLSPASLSPTSTDEERDSSNNNDNKNVSKSDVKNSKTEKFSSTVQSNAYQNQMLQTRAVTTQSPHMEVPKKLTNEFTMAQVSEMKQRMINTHKLLLNFNLLKDSYAKTCVEMKNALINLKDAEIHRAHLLIENESLKKELESYKLSVSEDIKKDTLANGASNV